jgi:hypothetical protein
MLAPRLYHEEDWHTANLKTWICLSVALPINPDRDCSNWWSFGPFSRIRLRRRTSHNRNEDEELHHENQSSLNVSGSAAVRSPRRQPCEANTLLRPSTMLKRINLRSCCPQGGLARAECLERQSIEHYRLLCNGEKRSIPMLSIRSDRLTERSAQNADWGGSAKARILSQR